MIPHITAKLSRVAIFMLVLLATGVQSHGQQLNTEPLHQKNVQPPPPAAGGQEQPRAPGPRIAIDPMPTNSRSSGTTGKKKVPVPTSDARALVPTPVAGTKDLQEESQGTLGTASSQRSFAVGPFAAEIRCEDDKCSVTSHYAALPGTTTRTDPAPNDVDIDTVTVVPGGAGEDAVCLKSLYCWAVKNGQMKYYPYNLPKKAVPFPRVGAVSTVPQQVLQQVTAAAIAGTPAATQRLPAPSENDVSHSPSGSTDPIKIVDGAAKNPESGSGTEPPLSDGSMAIDGRTVAIAALVATMLTAIIPITHRRAPVFLFVFY